MEDSHSRWDKIKERLRINKHLLPLKTIMFLYYGACTLFLPYITLHMVQIGITIEEVAIIYAVLPFASCLGPPVAGMIADKLGNYKLVFMTSIFLTGTFHTILMAIDARGYDMPMKNESNNSSYVNLLCYGEQTYLQYPPCPMDSCQDEDIHTGTLILDSMECFQLCNDSWNPICDPPYEECSSIQLQFQVDNDNDIMTQGDMCYLPISKMMHNNSLVEFQCPCESQCTAMVTGLKPGCLSNETSIPFYDHARHKQGFWLYFFVRILATATLGTCFTMLDTSSICMIKKHKGHLGKQRLLGVIGSALFGLLSGIIIDWYSNIRGYRDYSISFVSADVLLIVVLIVLFFMDLEADKSPEHFFRGFFQLIRLVDVDIFMIMMLLLGNCWGFLEAFLFIFLIELKATSYLLGLTVTLGSVVGLPFLYISDTIVKKIGKITVLISAFFVYCIRFLGYSFIEDPWLSLPFEAMEAVTIHLMGVSMSIFCAAAAPTGLLATLQGIAGSFHYNIGRGVGSFVGGILIASYGTRNTFRILGTVAGICGIVFIFLNKFIMEKYETERQMKRTETLSPTPLTSYQDDENHSDSSKNSYSRIPSEEVFISGE